MQQNDSLADCAGGGGGRGGGEPWGADGVPARDGRQRRPADPHESGRWSRGGAREDSIAGGGGRQSRQEAEQGQYSREAGSAAAAAGQDNSVSLSLSLSLSVPSAWSNPSRSGQARDCIAGFGQAANADASAAGETEEPVAEELSAGEDEEAESGAVRGHPTNVDCNPTRWP